MTSGNPLGKEAAANQALAAPVINKVVMWHTSSVKRMEIRAIMSCPAGDRCRWYKPIACRTGDVLGHARVSTCGQNASGQTVEIARASDLAVVPTGRTVDDLHPGDLFAHSLNRRGIPRDRIAFAMFRTTGSIRETEAAQQYLAEAGYSALEGEIPASGRPEPLHRLRRNLSVASRRSG